MSARDEMLGQISAALLSARFGGGTVGAVTRRTVDEALAPAVLPVMAAELRRLADHISDEYEGPLLGDPEAYAYADAIRLLRSRADQFDEAAS